MSGWDNGQVFSANLDMKLDDEDYLGEDLQENTSKSEAQSKFRQFIRSFRDDNDKFVYRDQLHANYAQEEYYLLVNCAHISGFDYGLMKLLAEKPAEFLPIFEEAALDVVANLTMPRPARNTMQPIQIQLTNYNVVTDIRKLGATEVAKLVTVKGIVVSAGKSRVKATALTIMCRNCKYTKTIKCGAGFGGARLPRECETKYVPDSGMPKCPLDPFRILPDSSKYIDQQRLKLQETLEMVPTGEMPRHISLSLDRYLVGNTKPGTRVTACGIYTTYTSRGKKVDKSSSTADLGIRLPYVRVIGILEDTEATSMLVGKFRPEDEEQCHEISQQPELYQKIANSIAPNLFGHEDIKRAIACQLFGGARKHLPDGMRLRGDVNILLLGDPSVGKSQFLKFAIQAAPIGVYTSGKGSSAAGLTASVIRDPSSGDFHLEGGALVLADGGLVCIDEFDKMREQDRVAIHEAMEQQTISIAKAGITTILNSRTSVLAAANPIFSRYDDMKTPTENIDFQTTILSRFDLIFIVRDLQDERKDMQLAKYIINVHRNKDDAAKQNAENDAGLIPMEALKKYIAYCRHNVDPRLSEDAAELLRSRYVTFRSQMREQKKANKGQSAIPITVRQLEAIVRLSESLARLEMKDVADEHHVKEAIRLFKVSTFQAATAKMNTGGDMQKIRAAERYMERRVPIGSSVSWQKLLQEMIRDGHSESEASRAMQIMISRNKFRTLNQRKRLERLQ